MFRCGLVMRCGAGGRGSNDIETAEAGNCLNRVTVIV